MRLAIIGGRLQGTEASYLARQAGYEVLLIDRDPDVPASSLADEFIVMDVVNDPKISDILRTADLIIPANEDILTISKIDQTSRDVNRPYVYDPRAYAVSSCKNTSNAFFKLAGIPIPKQWPDCTFPLIVKPSNLSGSAGVQRINNEHELTKYFAVNKDLSDNMVIEQYIDGVSLSLEVVALNGQALALQVTELEFDSKYDCKRVLAGAPVNREVELQLREIGCLLAKSLNLTGIMDIEVMVDGVIPRVIEIDARLPSQTPTAVLHSTGINMIELLAEVFVNGKLPTIKTLPQRSVIYEHVEVSCDHIEITGEHVLSSAGKLVSLENRYGFDRVITDYTGHEKSWVATLITTGASPAEANLKRQKALARMMAEHDLKVLVDPIPSGYREMAV